MKRRVLEEAVTIEQSLVSVTSGTKLTADFFVRLLPSAYLQVPTLGSRIVTAIDLGGRAKLSPVQDN